MPYVSSRISDGLGNRFFQVAAALGYAEKHGHTPVFIKDWVLDTNHEGPKNIYDYFPALQTISLVPGWTLLEAGGDDSYTFVNLPRVEGHAYLKGYFQSEKYFPTGGVPRPAALTGLESRYRNFAFLHVRRGDYLLPVCRHHYVDLRAYYRYALALFADSDTRILVCSDDIEWCRETLPAEYSDLISTDRWEFLGGDVTDFDTLRAMTACGRGGICANSTFSWWGAYWSVGRAAVAQHKGIYTMPAVWGAPPLPPTRNLYPDWATVLPT
jgi:hypothetical protein